MYDFRRCKLCSASLSVPLYVLRDSTIYACPQCGFHYADDLDDISPAAIQDESVLTDKARNYMESRLHENRAQNASRLNLMKRHAVLAQAQCLDVGAGVGAFLDLLEREGAIVHGIEPSAPRREFARGRYGLSLHRELIDHPLWQEGFRNSFDMVTLWDVIEHVNFPLETLAGVRDVLRPGGMLFFDTPSREALDYRLGEFSYRLSSGKCPLFLETIYDRVPFGHKQIFTPRQLVDLLKRLGFEVLRVDRRHEPLVSPGENAPSPLLQRLRPGKGIVLVARKPLAEDRTTPPPARRDPGWAEGV